jgi:hypothetical protein
VKSKWYFVEIDKDGFWRNAIFSTIQGLIRDSLKGLIYLVSAFLVGSGIGALVCLYCGFPLVLSFVGGLIVMGVALSLLIFGISY